MDQLPDKGDAAPANVWGSGSSGFDCFGLPFLKLPHMAKNDPLACDDFTGLSLFRCFAKASGTTVSSASVSRGIVCQIWTRA